MVNEALVGVPEPGGAAQRVEQLSSRERQLLQAAARVFARQGYANATVQEVADELGILKGSVYHYVRTKDDLLFAVIKGFSDGIQVMYEEVAAEPDLDPLERFAYCIRRQVRYAVTNRVALAVYARDSGLLSDARREWFLEVRARNTAFVRGLIERAQAAGLATTRHNPETLTQLCFGAITSAASWFDPERSDLEQLANSTAEFFVLGIVGDNSV